MSDQKKLVLVIGATGAQGLAVINALLAPASDGTTSPYRVRALTRDSEHRRAKELADRGVELAVGMTRSGLFIEIEILIIHSDTGRFDDYEKVRAAFQGAWGAWVNTDGATVGEEREIYAGTRIFEVAKRTPSLKHYVYSGLDYMFKKGGYKDEYRCGHYDGKARVVDWLRAQPSDPSGFMWSVVSTGPYMDMLHYVGLPRLEYEDGIVPD
jgi:hypothetical protein